MTTVSEAIRPYAESFEALAALRSGKTPAWLPALRKDAFTHFTDTGFPNARSEDWKYMPTRPLERRAFISLPATQAAPAIADIQSVLLEDDSVYTLVFVDGRHSTLLSRTGSGIAGLHIHTLDQTIETNPAWLESALASESIWRDDPFTALNTAFLQEGMVIVVDDGVQLEAPLQLVFVSTKQPQPLACHPRILLQLGQGAQATLLESWLGLEGAGNFANSYMQITLGKDARLEHLRLQRESVEDFHVSRVTVEQQSDSRYLSHTLNLGGLWIRNDLHSRLEATGAESVFNGLYLVDGRQHVDNHTRIEHLAPATRSNELYRGIINGHGHAVFNGKVVVARHAIKTDAAQTNNNLLLSRQGEIDTKPELEIYADDVKCSHGATIGQLDEHALFYLRSRGLGLEEARNLLVGAFALAVLDRIAAPALRVFARRQLTTLLPQSAVMESA